MRRGIATTSTCASTTPSSCSTASGFLRRYATTLGIFSLRTPKHETPMLDRYVPRMLDEAWTVFKAHYGFVPSTPVYIEMYESREQFSVRSSGLPDLGIEGVCFGHVVSALSPSAEPFNWGNVLWHELAHVFAIQLSKNHVPRWFTEGLSEYETMIHRPEWKRELDPELYIAIEGFASECRRHESGIFARG